MAVKFGTSGLRGLADGFDATTCEAYVRAFLEVTCRSDEIREVYVGSDLRASSPRIARHCAAAVIAAGHSLVNAGNVPTPALACFALKRHAPAIMVTGSHIPEEYNGIKFYRPDGEFLKEDEEPVRARAQGFLKAESVRSVPPPPAPVDPAIAEAYVNRYAEAFPGAPLAGLRIGVDLHSAVGRDLTVAILEHLGAEVQAFRRADHFIAVDTEAVAPADVERARAILVEQGLAAVVSTDGDGDRPLVIDERGTQINGDILGALTARALGISTVVTPLTSTTAIELSGWFGEVVRTRIGSPYVVAAMAEARAKGASAVAGFEANGGFLLETDLAVGNGLSRLPTRDAILPLVGVLLSSVKRGKSLSALAAELPARVMKADRLQNIAADVGQAFLDSMATSETARKALDPRLAAPVAINRTDGVRLSLAEGTIVHFRQSGNAPELRCYVETASLRETERTLAEIVGQMRKVLQV